MTARTRQALLRADDATESRHPPVDHVTEVPSRLRSCQRLWLRTPRIDVLLAAAFTVMTVSNVMWWGCALTTLCFLVFSVEIARGTAPDRRVTG
jgi:hypothetical protein